MSGITEPVQDPLFDADELAREQLCTEAWQGVPLGITVYDYHDPEELRAAMVRWLAEHGEFAGGGGMWCELLAGDDIGEPVAAADGHELFEFAAQPAGLAVIHQAICPGCRWHHIGTGKEVVEAWHDHAMPGWRELPVVPEPVTDIAEWMEGAYPPGWVRPGAPIRTRRHPKTRARRFDIHVPHGSPMGGYDMAAPAE